MQTSTLSFAFLTLAMRNSRTTFAPGLLVALGLTGAHAFAQSSASFQSLGVLNADNPFSQALAVSGDGEVVVGKSRSPIIDFEPFRWTAETGMAALPLLDPGHVEGSALDVSFDGSVIVGWSRWGPPDALRWTSEGQIVENLFFSAQASAVAEDGTIAGHWGLGPHGYQFAFRWTSDEGPTLILAGLPPGLPSSYNNFLVTDVTSDGSTVIANLLANSGDSYAMRQQGSQDWELLGSGHALAQASSADASIVVGSVFEGATATAARWDDVEGAWLQLDPTAETAFHVTADGSVIVGGSELGCANCAFIWDADNGAQNLKGLLGGGHGLDLSGWQLAAATGVSDDGLTIIGYGTNPDGNTEAWIARLPDLCPADLNDDTVVNVPDLLALLAAWGTNPGGPPDFDGDGVVAVPDLLTLLAAWGPCP